MDVSVCPSICLLKKPLGTFREFKAVVQVINKKDIFEKENALN